MGHGAVRRYYEWQLFGPHDKSAVAAECDGVLAGFCFAGIFRGSFAGFLQKNRMYLAGAILVRPWLVFHEIVRNRIGSALKVLNPFRAKKPAGESPKRKVKSYGILAIAVDPRIQGAGAGKRLMEDCEARAIKAGFPQLHLTVDPKNQQAVGFYERLGWKRVAFNNQDWQGYMEKPLQPAVLSQQGNS